MNGWRELRQAARRLELGRNFTAAEDRPDGPRGSSDPPASSVE